MKKPAKIQVGKIASMESPQPGIEREFFRVGELNRAGRRDEARAAAKSLYASHPNDATANFLIALLLDENNQKGDALQFARAAVKLAPNNVRNLVFLGKLYVDLDMIEYAPAILHRAFELDKTVYQAPRALANYHYSSGQGNRALPYFDMALKAAPAGARDELVKGINDKERDQVLLGVTGSGKTFTVAKIIEATQRPALILAPNKTLAAQLYGEFASFFPENAVEYFVSYYDYYTPEAYVARTDTFIEKESSINEQIDRMRHSATRALLERDDVIVVASVSCIYGIGDVETYSAMSFQVKKGERLAQRQLLADFVRLHYKRNDANFVRGSFRVRGDTVELFPSHFEDRAWRFSFFGDEIETIAEFDPLTGQKAAELEQVKIYSNSHYVTPKPTLEQAVRRIRIDLEKRLAEFKGGHNPERAATV